MESIVEVIKIQIYYLTVIVTILQYRNFKYF